MVHDRHRSPLLYYIVPKEVKRPLYGYTLALIAFWCLAFFYTAVGTHHILQAPVPEWLKTISVIYSIGLLIPVTAFVINMFMTMRGSWRRRLLLDSAALRADRRVLVPGS